MTGDGRESWDVVVVGGGAAGLSAALTLARARRSVLVLDDGTPRNAPAEGVHNYLGREGAPPRELVRIGRGEVEGHGATVRDAHVVDATRLADGTFALTVEGAREELVTRRLVVATGLTDELPDVDGLAERWGRDVLHCPYCHGWEVRDQRIGVLATSPLALHQVQLLRQWSDDVVLLTHTADELVGERMTSDQRAELVARGIEIVDGVVAAVEVTDDRLTGVRLAAGNDPADTTDGTVVALDALAVAPRAHARASIPAVLGAEPQELRMGGAVVGDAVPTETTGPTAGATSVPGLYAIGNVADVRAVVIAAAAAGVTTGAAVNADLVAEDVRVAVAAHRRGEGARFWEGFYAERDQIWSGRPNATLVDVVDGLTPGTALDLGAGEGGDAVWLAGQGWKVTAVDVATRALERITAAATARGLGVETQRHDLSVSFPTGSWDLVSAQYLHSMHEFDRPAVLRAAADAVAPGGLLVIVGHGRLAPWSWDPTLAMPTAEDVFADLALDPDGWDVERVASPERTVTHEDRTATITDEIVAVRRRKA